MIQSVRTFKETVDMRRFGLRRIRSYRYATAIGLGILILGVACVHIWQRVTVIQLSKEVSRLEVDQSDLIDQTRKVNSEIAALSMAARIETFAVDSLGLFPISGDRLYTVINDRKADPKAAPDQLATLVDALQRVRNHLPAITTTEVEARTPDSAKFDSLRQGGGIK
ncbi:MAG: hypothetical protein HY851_04530 [candidate division Zixibacteria bacterium]|nr:hypothetical protein [candidate division Zixibacteria bacterium]